MTSTLELEKIVKTSSSISSILKKLGYSQHLNSKLYTALKKRLNADQIDYSHILTSVDSNLNRNVPRYTKDTFLKKLENLKILHHGDKKRLLKYSIIPNSNCSICQIGRIWNEKVLVLQIDHIDGDPTNNKVTNLRFVCPNCHSQTDTFCYGLKQRNTCIDCNVRITKKSSRCIVCASIHNKRIKKFEISNEELFKLVCIEKLPFTVIGKKFGVSDNAIRKRCKSLNIDVKLRIKI